MQGPAEPAIVPYRVDKECAGSYPVLPGPKAGPMQIPEEMRMATGAGPREAYRIAADMERQGESLYRSLAEEAEEASVRAVYLELADEEAGHRELMEQLAEKYESVTPHGGYDPQRAMELLRGYRSVFDGDRLSMEKERAVSPGRAIDFAIRREMDSIMFYHEAREMVSAISHSHVDRIIDEERKHFRQLSRIRAEMGEEVSS